MYVFAVVLHAIDAVGVGVIVWTRVLLQYLLQNGVVCSYYFQGMPVCCVGKAATGFRMAVGIGNVRLDVEDWGAVHDVGSQNMYYRAVRSIIINMADAY